MAGQRRIEKSQTPRSPSPSAPDLAPQRERTPELDTDDGPRLGAPSRVEHHAQDAVDAGQRVLEARVHVRRIVRRSCAPHFLSRVVFGSPGF
jgi:hypothetical protein